MAKEKKLNRKEILKDVKQIQNNLVMSNIDIFTTNTKEANNACDYYYKAQEELWRLVKKLGGSNYSKLPKTEKERKEAGLK